jgi:hypothetical protein
LPPNPGGLSGFGIAPNPVAVSIHEEELDAGEGPGVILEYGYNVRRGRDCALASNTLGVLAYPSGQADVRLLPWLACPS